MGVGCAEYSGQSSTDAKTYIDYSQGKRGFAHSNPAHPRNHCSVPNSDSKTPCVENYSKGSRKTGFLSEKDQNLVGHHVLSHPRVQGELNVLNQYNRKTHNDNNYTRRVINISTNELKIKTRKIMAGEWVNGVLTSVSDMQSITIILQHFDGQETNPDAPVHILTFYPRMSSQIKMVDDIDYDEFNLIEFGETCRSDQRDRSRRKHRDHNRNNQRDRSRSNQRDVNSFTILATTSAACCILMGALLYKFS